MTRDEYNALIILRDLEENGSVADPRNATQVLSVRTAIHEFELSRVLRLMVKRGLIRVRGNSKRRYGISLLGEGSQFLQRFGDSSTEDVGTKRARAVTDLVLGAKRQETQAEPSGETPSETTDVSETEDLEPEAEEEFSQPGQTDAYGELTLDQLRHLRVKVLALIMAEGAVPGSSTMVSNERIHPANPTRSRAFINRLLLEMSNTRLLERGRIQERRQAFRLTESGREYFNAHCGSLSEEERSAASRGEIDAQKPVSVLDSANGSSARAKQADLWAQFPEDEVQVLKALRTAAGSGRLNEIAAMAQLSKDEAAEILETLVAKGVARVTYAARPRQWGLVDR